ncbi:hypothetical protein C3L33_18836, partial [Rhododendron williamsianum]
MGNSDFSNPSTRHPCSPQLSHSLSPKSLSPHSRGFRNSSYLYDDQANGRLVSNLKTERKNPATYGYLCRLLKLNAPEWRYSIMGVVGSILCGFISPTVSIAMSNIFVVFYYRNFAVMERKTNEYVMIFIGTGFERISVILQNVTSLLASFIVAFIVDWRFSLLTSATFPLLVLAFCAQKFSLKGFAGDTAKAHAKTSMIAGEGVRNIRTVAAFNAQDKTLSLFCHELRVTQLRSLSRSQTSGLLFGLSQLSMYFSQALFFWYGAHLVKKGTSTFSQIVKVVVILVMAASSFAETLALAPEIIGGSQAIGSIFSIIDRSTKIDADDPDAEPVDSVRGEIELCHVDFSYPLRPNVLVFKDFNLRIQAGQSQALVGESGSGKSSVIALIERFYDPLAGTVMIDGKDIKRLNLKSLRLKIGLVSQEPALFAASIFDNIAYGKDGATEAEVTEAAEWQMCMPSLADYRRGPRNTFTDEATSALDAEAECVLQEALESLMRGRTTMLVAHRLSTIRGVNSIAVIQDGRIVEQGSHSELVSRHDGAYSRLCSCSSTTFDQVC